MVLGVGRVYEECGERQLHCWPKWVTISETLRVQNYLCVGEYHEEFNVFFFGGGGSRQNKNPRSSVEILSNMWMKLPIPLIGDI